MINMKTSKKENDIWKDIKKHQSDPKFIAEARRFIKSTTS